MRHVFLSGRDDIDRSLIIDKTLEALGPRGVSGYRTVSVKSTIENAQKEVYLTPWGEESIREERYLAGVLWDDGIYTGFPEVFDDVGLKILNAIPKDADLIVIDEIGLFEMAAPMFSVALFKRLEEDVRVFGVLQRKDTPFHDVIRYHEKVSIIEVAEGNLMQAPDLVLQVFME